jgi:alanine racemase
VKKRSWVEVSLAAIARNYRAVKALTGPGVSVMPVVKADAYRHGAVEVSRALCREGAEWLAVSNSEEGLRLRDAGIEARILVMADFPEVSEVGLTPVVHSLDSISRVRGPYHLKVDTGMGRLGTRETVQQIAGAVRANPQAELEGLMTHFASAADYIGTQTDEQAAEFARIDQGLRELGIEARYRHTSSTIAIAYGRRHAWHNMVRPGHAIYGYVSPARGDAPAQELQVEPALAWRASVLEVKDMPKGVPIGYGARFTTPRPMRVGVLAVGYADGVPHSLGGRPEARFIAGGRWAPVLGAVSMDLTSIDLSAAPHLKPGDSVTLIGREGDLTQDAQTLARAARTISYSLLCGIHARVERVYV